MVFALNGKACRNASKAQANLGKVMRQKRMHDMSLFPQRRDARHAGRGRLHVAVAWTAVLIEGINRRRIVVALQSPRKSIAKKKKVSVALYRCNGAGVLIQIVSTHAPPFFPTIVTIFSPFAEEFQSRYRELCQNSAYRTSEGTAYSG
jgi:hypothetical protein